MCNLFYVQERCLAVFLDMKYQTCLTKVKTERDRETVRRAHTAWRPGNDTGRDDFSKFQSREKLGRLLELSYTYSRSR